MSWNKQMEDMVQNWTSMQQQMWDSWLQAMKGMGAPGSSAQGMESVQQEYQKNLEAWEKAVRDALDAQSQWSIHFADALEKDGQTPEAVSQWVHQVQEMMKAWTEAQGQLWNAWFESARNVDPSKMGSNWEEEGQRVLHAWQDATQRAQDALAELSKTATRMGEEAPKAAKAPKAPGKPGGGTRKG